MEELLMSRAPLGRGQEKQLRLATLKTHGREQSRQRAKI